MFASCSLVECCCLHLRDGTNFVKYMGYKNKEKYVLTYGWNTVIHLVICCTVAYLHGNCVYLLQGYLINIQELCHGGRPTFRPIHCRPTCFRPTYFRPTLFSSNPGFIQSTFVHDLYSSNLFSFNFSPFPFFCLKKTNIFFYCDKNKYNIMKNQNPKKKNLEWFLFWKSSIFR